MRCRVVVFSEPPEGGPYIAMKKAKIAMERAKKFQVLASSLLNSDVDDKRQRL